MERPEMTSTDEAFKKAANSPATRQAANTARELGEEASDFVDDVSRQARKQFSRAQDAAVDAYGTAYAAARRDPLTAFAIAVGIGFLFGVVVGTRR
jgi:ElaB/YqjD/DUF883 family membrane-anchored ribosome-binding protein